MGTFCHLGAPLAPVSSPEATGEVPGGHFCPPESEPRNERGTGRRREPETSPEGSQNGAKTRPEAEREAFRDAKGEC